MKKENLSKKKRSQLGLTRKQFAELLGVSWRTVCGWEIGREPSETARRLIEGLKA